MKIPFITKWLERRKIKVYVADFITLEMRKARLEAIRQMREEYKKETE
jgi:hypothetical protein